MDLQQAAYESIRDEIVKLDEHFAQSKRAIPPGTVQANLIAVDPRTGQVWPWSAAETAAPASSTEYPVKRQRGVFKPFVYSGPGDGLRQRHPVDGGIDGSR
jgi:membrane peptidoglycan carboxypeptidase